MDGGPKGLGNSTTSSRTGASGGLVRRMESGNLENERVHCTHNVPNYNHTQFSSSSAGYHEGPVRGDWNSKGVPGIEAVTRGRGGGRSRSA